jgi:hypothetical protein
VSRGTPLRCCGRCGGSFLGDNRDEIWFCPSCTKKLPPFDPQPYSVGGSENQRARMNWAGWKLREVVVLAREGDMVTVRPLGNPDIEPVTVHVSVLRPAYITPGH